MGPEPDDPVGGNVVVKSLVKEGGRKSDGKTVGGEWGEATRKEKARKKGFVRNPGRKNSGAGGTPVLGKTQRNETVLQEERETVIVKNRRVKG